MKDLSQIPLNCNYRNVISFFPTQSYSVYFEINTQHKMFSLQPNQQQQYSVAAYN